MLPSRALARRLTELGRNALATLREPEPLDVTVVSPVVSRLDTIDPIEHLRRAIASKKTGDSTITDAKLYSQLRLLLNQLESGRISSAPTQDLERVPFVAALPAPKPRLRTLLRRKAQAVVSRVTRSF